MKTVVPSDLYVRSVVLFLGMTMVLKVTGLVQVGLKLATPTELEYFALPAPFIPAISNVWMVTFGALFEGVAIALLCMIESRTRRLAFIAWIGGVFFAYHIGLLLTEYTLPCGCLGGVAAWLRLPKAWADRIMALLIVYFLVGSYWFLLNGRLRTFVRHDLRLANGYIRCRRQ